MTATEQRETWDRFTATTRERVDAVAGRAGPVVVIWALGLLWLSNVNWKVPTKFGALRGFVHAGVDHPVFPGSAWFFEHVVLPHMGAFGWLTLFVEVGLASTLLAGRFVRTAAIVSTIQAFAIGSAVANAPGEWYWSYLLMIALSIAVLTLAPRIATPSARTIAVIVAVYGAVMAIANAAAGFGGDNNVTRTLFTGHNDIPDEFGVSIFAGSIALGLLFVALGIAAWWAASNRPPVRRAVGWSAVALAALLLLTYRSSPDTLLIELGSRAVHCAVLAIVGLSLLPRPDAVTEGDDAARRAWN